MVFVFQQGKIEFAGEGLDLFEELLGFGVSVGTDSENLDPLVFFWS